MLVDFKEIPKANEGGGQQDRFEQFACDFLQTIGFKILRAPDRGPDGKKDLIVSELRNGIADDTTINWLVSCKHYAHSGLAVKDTDEPDIIDRINAHGCTGFMGFYSTIPSSSLSNKLKANKSKFESIIYDSARIEKLLLKSREKERFLLCFFPMSHSEYHKRLLVRPTSLKSKNQKNITGLTSDDLLEVSITAIILLEIEKIKIEYHESEWKTRKIILNKFYRFSEYSNKKVIRVIFDFLSAIAIDTRSGMPLEIAGLINTMIFNFYYSSALEDNDVYVANAKICIQIGFDLAYDSFIYLHDYKIAEVGLSILKFVYREASGKGNKKIIKDVLDEYKRLEHTLNRPERNDLDLAKNLVSIFKKDLKSDSLRSPL